MCYSAARGVQVGAGMLTAGVAALREDLSGPCRRGSLRPDPHVRIVSRCPYGRRTLVSEEPVAYDPDRALSEVTGHPPA
jgi:hypothetical protein